jgi:hypothetical protein
MKGQGKGCDQFRLIVMESLMFHFWVVVALIFCLAKISSPIPTASIWFFSVILIKVEFEHDLQKSNF